MHPKSAKPSTQHPPFFKNQSTTAHHTISLGITTSKPDWQHELANAITDPKALYHLLELDAPTDIHAPRHFGLKVPHAYLKKIKKGDPYDPLLLQILPNIAETLVVPGYGDDPLDEHKHNPTKGLLHKYQSRVLITVTGACAVHCRYCFRQHFDYNANLPKQSDLTAICDYVAADPAIEEVILSGGDPLSITNRKLALWLQALAPLKNIRTLRLHTRLPVVLPSRIDEELLGTLGDITAHKNVVMVLHINHANEIDDTLIQCCQALKAAGVTLLNQTVLLRGVNDNATVLAQLSHALFGAGILPYYLHVLDKVAGAAHFDVALERAVAIYWQLLAQVSGYLVPKLVQELPNQPYKVPIDIYANHIDKLTTVTDGRGDASTGD